jgi:hypothetical protein
VVIYRCTSFSGCQSVSEFSFRALQIHVSMHRFVTGHHIGPVLGMVVGVDEGEDGVVHVAELSTTGDVEKIEFDGLSVG